jgi:hypothetical protein
MARVDELLGEVDHLGDVLGRSRIHVGGQQVEECGIGMERRLVGVGDLSRRLVLQPRSDEHPVLTPVESLVPEVADVGDVLDVEDGCPVIEDDAPDEVGEKERPEVADMGIAVDGRSAGVHPEAPAVARLQGLDGSCQGVAESESHAGIVAAMGVPDDSPRSP